MNLAVVGTRYLDNIEILNKYLDPFIDRFDTIVSGGALGTDELAYRYAVLNGKDFICFPPREDDGNDKYRNRNKRIVEASDAVLAFPGKKSKGTWMTVSIAKELGKPVEIVNIGELYGIL